jgi:biopolymer transport protein ExbD
VHLRGVAVSLLFATMACTQQNEGSARVKDNAPAPGTVGIESLTVVTLGSAGTLSIDGVPVDDATVKARSTAQGRIYITGGPDSDYRQFTTVMDRLSKFGLPIALLGSDSSQ